MISVGEKAPDFEALDQDGRKFRLSSLRGSPVVLFFYPEADTPGCTIESKGFQSDLPGYQSKGVKVIGISVDAVPEQKAFAEKYGLTFPLICDTSKTITKSYGVLAELGGKARRVTFMIDPSGVVREVVDTSAAKTHLSKAKARYLAA